MFVLSVKRQKKVEKILKNLIWKQNYDLKSF